MDDSIRQELHTLLLPLVGEYELKKDTVCLEDVDSLIHFSELLHREKTLLEAVRANPNGKFWSFYNILVDSVPPETFPIIEDGAFDDEDEDD